MVESLPHSPSRRQEGRLRVAALVQRVSHYDAIAQLRLLPMERLLLQAYMHYEALHGAPAGHPGLCWPTDAEAADYLGAGLGTVRRSRHALAKPSDEQAPLIAVRAVAPGRELPNGETTSHGANVITILAIAGDLAGGNGSAPNAEESPQRGITSLFAEAA